MYDVDLTNLGWYTKRRLQPEFKEMSLVDDHKELPGLSIASGVGHLGVLRGVLNIPVPDPVLHKLEFAAGIEQTGGDRILCS